MKTAKQTRRDGGLAGAPRRMHGRGRLAAFLILTLGMFVAGIAPSGAFSLGPVGTARGASAPVEDHSDLRRVIDEATERIDTTNAAVDDVAPSVDDVVTDGEAVADDPNESPVDDGGDLPGDQLTEVVDELVEQVPEPSQMPEVGDVIDELTGPDDLDPTGPAASELLSELVGSVDELLPALQLGELQYDIRTRWGSGNSECTTERVTPAIVNVPTLVDVDDVVGPDVEVLLAVAPSLLDGSLAAQLDIRPLVPGNTDGLAVQAVLAPGEDSDRVAVGYDQCQAGVPNSFGLEFTADPESNEVELKVTSSAETDTLTVVANTFDEIDGAQTDPTDVALTFAPAPSSVTASARSTSDGFTFGFTSPTALDVAASLHRTSGATTTSVDANIVDLPRSLTVTTGPGSVLYEASASIPEVHVSHDSLESGVPTTSAVASLHNVPNRVEVRRGTSSDGGDHLAVSAETAAGTPFAADVEVFDGTDTVHASVGVDAMPAELGFDLTEQAVEYSASERIGEVTAEYRKGGRRAVATLRDVPTAISISTSAADGDDVISWRSSARLGEVLLTVEDSTPIIGPATSVSAELRGLPTRASISVSDSSFVLRSDGVDVFEVTAGNGGTLIPAASDGLRYIDDGERFFLHGRLSGLRNAFVADAGSISMVTWRVDGDRPFVLDLRTASRRISGDIADIPDRASVVYRNLSTQLLFYSASQRSGAATLDIREDGNLKRLALPTGLPTDLEACVQADGLTCLTGPITADYDTFSARIDVDQPIRVQYYDCTPGPNSRNRVCDPAVVRPDSFADGVGHGRDFTWVDLTIDQRLEIGFARESDFAADAARLRLDTQFGSGGLTSRGIRGSVRMGEAESNGDVDEKLDFTLGLLRAQDRVLTLDCDFSCSILTVHASTSGRILCRNVSLKVDLENLIGYFDVQRLIC